MKCRTTLVVIEKAKGREVWQLQTFVKHERCFDAAIRKKQFAL